MIYDLVMLRLTTNGHSNCFHNRAVRLFVCKFYVEKHSQHSLLFIFRLDGKHVVFGSVIEGLDVIQKVEGFGSESGKTSKPIKVDNSGQLS